VDIDLCSACAPDPHYPDPQREDDIEGIIAAARNVLHHIATLQEAAALMTTAIAAVRTRRTEQSIRHLRAIARVIGSVEKWLLDAAGSLYLMPCPEGCGCWREGAPDIDLCAICEGIGVINCDEYYGLKDAADETEQETPAE